MLLTDIETAVISAFPFSQLFNFKKEASSMLGYKHTKQAIAKMKARFLNKQNHPMFGKTHSESSKYLISKPGSLNPMFGKTHNEVTKQLMSIKKSMIPLGLYDENNNFIEKFSNALTLVPGWGQGQVELANKFGVHKSRKFKYLQG